jgi:adenylate kinase
MTARGEALRPDDNPEVLHRRLAAYREQTAPLIAYYRRHGMLRSVDGMAPIAEVARQIEGALAEAANPPKKPPASARPARTPKPSLGKKSKTRKKAPSRKLARAAHKRSAAKVKSKAKSKARSTPKTGLKSKARLKARPLKRRR